MHNRSTINRPDTDLRQAKTNAHSRLPSMNEDRCNEKYKHSAAQHQRQNRDDYEIVRNLVAGLHGSACDISFPGRRVPVLGDRDSGLAAGRCSR